MSFDSKVPLALLDLQKWVAEILVLPFHETGEQGLPVYEAKRAASIQHWIKPSRSLCAEQRIGIYNQQFWFRMYVILQKDYPTLTRLFGYNDFNRLMVEPYLAKYFPDHWSLALLGAKLPQWIEEEYHDEDKILVYQAAQIDELYERLFFAKGLPPLQNFKDPIYLQPHVGCLDLDGDLISFRETLIQEEPEYWVQHDFPHIDWSKKRSFVLYVSGSEIYHEEVSHAEAILLKAFGKGALLEEALSLLDGGLEEDSKPWIAEWFRKWAQRGWLGSF